MPLSANLVHYLISYVVALLVFGLLAKWCIWPRIKDPPAATALPPFRHRSEGVTRAHEILAIEVIGRASGSRGDMEDDDAAAEHRPLATRFGQDARIAILSYRPLAVWMLGYLPRSKTYDKR